MMVQFSGRIMDVPKSFIREILKVAINPEIISFAGGLPNKDLFPVSEIQQAADIQFEEYGRDILQYSSTEGYLPLREYIAARYKEKKNLEVPTDNILITSGSQQALDLLGKVFIDKGDKIIIEEPGYLGAIQAFSIYEPKFSTVPLNERGLDNKCLNDILDKSNPKLIYLVPNFQNPSGISSSEDNRKETANLISERDLYLIEDDPYGELRYVGKNIKSFKKYLPKKTILLGSFSKVVAPSFRIGWIVAPDDVMDKLIIAKQASDLHTNFIGQRIIYQFLISNNLDEHVEKIKNKYNKQREKMLSAIEQYLPSGVSSTKPEGGMFLWLTLPEKLNAKVLFEKALNKKVAFVPGDPFYIGKRDLNTLRLNFSCVNEDKIEEGIKRLGTAIEESLDLRRRGKYVER